jgi:regulator of sirC expression with transglutaminase-like and TPR domain
MDPNTKADRAMVSLLFDDDNYVSEKVAHELKAKGLYAISLLQEADYFYADTSARGQISDLYNDVIQEEILSEFRNKEPDMLKCAYFLNLLFTPFFPYQDFKSFMASMVVSFEKEAAGVANPIRRFDILNEVFFNRFGFKGNMNEYYTIDNSLINQVIRRKTGIPISLSIIYLHLARLLNMDIVGLSLPGHFMCRFHLPNYTGIIDVFNNGRILTFQEGHWFLASMGHKIDIEKYPAATAKDITRRMIMNLIRVTQKLDLNDLSAQIQDLLTRIDNV